MKKETILYAWYGEQSDPQQYTAGEREKYFMKEGKKWCQWFFDCLAKTGRCRTNFAVYTLENKSPL